jgi:endonuclease YncB( thermonuclease family)
LVPTALVNGASDKVLLNGIDCSETGQVYSQCVKQATAALVYRKEVTLQAHDKEKCGCTIGDVLLPDDTNVNHALFKDGWYVIVTRDG